MKNLKLLLNVWLVIGQLLASSAHAEFTLDMNFRAIPGVIDQDGLESWKPITGPRDTLLKSEGSRSPLGDQMAIGHLVWDGQTYYVTGTSYQTRQQLEENHRAVVAHEKGSKALPNGGVCELFLYDTQLKLLARHKVKLPDDGGGPWCNGSHALGRAMKNLNALLYSITYYPVDTALAKRPEDIGKGWRNSTYLIRLIKEADGSVRFVQDDSCLGNPNSFATVTDARKALERCPMKSE